jgi:phosphoglycerate dehydrogenase-like enzyme
MLYQWHSFSTALQENWDAASSLQWVHVSAAGVSQLLFDELISSNIVYTNSRGVLSRAIAEFALGFVLDMGKGAQTSFRLQQQHRWRHRGTRKSRANPHWWSAPDPSAAKSPAYSTPWP